MATARTVDRSRPVPCAHCGEPVVPKLFGPLPKFCGGTCKALACTARATDDGRATEWANAGQARRQASLLARVFTCAHAGCGATFSPGLRARRYCTAVCAMRAYNARREDDGRLARYRAERRQREYSQACGNDVFSTAEVMERDDWTCWLCNEAIDASVQWPAPASRSVDHVVPLSKGGSHSLANVRAAHLRCNLIKGNRLVDAA